jgi:hypothetical protein
MTSEPQIDCINDLDLELENGHAFIEALDWQLTIRFPVRPRI